MLYCESWSVSVRRKPKPLPRTAAALSEKANNSSITTIIITTITTTIITDVTAS